MTLSEVKEVDISEISIQDSNVRSDLSSPNSQENLRELAENIALNGLLQPIVLRGPEGKIPYDVIVGQRRFLAHKLLGKEKIKATFSDEVNDIEALLLSLSENMCRQEMNYEDTSKAITTLYNYYDKDVNKVKAHTGFSIQMIRRYVDINEQASEKMKQYLSKGAISLIDAKRIIDTSQGDLEKADILIDEIGRLSKYEKIRLVESGIKNPKNDAGSLLEIARQPKKEETIILNLPRRIHKALLDASQKLFIDVEELAISTITTWLKTNDFLVD